MIIPLDSLERTTLERIVEEFVTRDGTDYGEIELDLETKVEQLLAQLHAGQIFICFDEATESVNLLGVDQLPNGKSVREPERSHS